MQEGSEVAPADDDEEPPVFSELQRKKTHTTAGLKHIDEDTKLAYTREIKKLNFNIVELTKVNEELSINNRYFERTINQLEQKNRELAEENWSLADQITHLQALQQARKEENRELRRQLVENHSDGKINEYRSLLEDEKNAVKKEQHRLRKVEDFLREARINVATKEEQVQTKAEEVSAQLAEIKEQSEKLANRDETIRRNYDVVVRNFNEREKALKDEIRLLKKERTNSNKREQRRLKASPIVSTPISRPTSNRRDTRRIDQLSRRGLWGKITRTVQLVKESLGDTDSEAAKATATTILRKVCKRIGIDIGQSTRLSPEADLEITTLAKLTSKQRETLKKLLRKYGLDIFSPTNQYKQLVTDITTGVSVEVREIEEPTINDNAADEEQTQKKKSAVVTELNDVRKVFTARVQRVYDEGNLDMRKEFGNEIWMSVVGDKGDDLTKLGIVLGNVDDSNSYRNLTMVAMYEGNDKHEELERKIRSSIDQINALTSITINTPDGMLTIPVRQFLNGDYNFEAASIGIQGASGMHNCIKCLRNKGVRLGNNEDKFPPRTLENLEDHRKSKKYNVVGKALFTNIPIDQINVSPLHVMMGLCDIHEQMLRSEAIRLDAEELGLIGISSEHDAEKKKKNLEKEVARMKKDPRIKGNDSREQTTREIEEKLNMCRILKKLIDLGEPNGRKLHEAYHTQGLLGNKHYKAKTGNQIKKILSDGIAEYLWSSLPTNQELRNIKKCNAMKILGRIMKFTEAKFLNDDEIDTLIALINTYKVALTEIDPDISVTPKLHSLFHHTDELVMKWRTWGKLSEHIIESVHPKVNEYRNRFKSIKDKKQRIRLVMKMLTLENYIKDTNKVPKHRKRTRNDTTVSTPNTREDNDMDSIIDEILGQMDSEQYEELEQQNNDDYEGTEDTNMEMTNYLENSVLREWTNYAPQDPTEDNYDWIKQYEGL